MNKISNVLTSFLDAAIAPPAKAAKHDPGADISPPVPMPQQRHVAALLKFCNLPEKATRAKLDKLAEQFHEELAVSGRLLHPDFEHERQTALAVAGKIKPSEVITRTAVFSREAALLGADVLEVALEKLPQFIQQLKTHEDVLHNASGSAPEPEFFAKFSKRLEAHVRKLVKNHLENTTVCDPSELLK